jgi:UDP-GlcNAc:undecaprenyl-phosphate GlcNAc-1-phosphate transferase
MVHFSGSLGGGMNTNALQVMLEILCAATATFAALWVLQPLAIRFGLLDRPAGRKDHAEPTPSTGGIAMLIGVSLTLAVCNSWSQPLACFMIAATLLVAIGVLDDLFDVRWWIRVIAQCAAVWVMSLGGVGVEHIGLAIGVQSMGLGMFSLPFTMFATVGVINAINMTDGVDGLAGGIVLASLCMLEAAALYSGNYALAERLAVFGAAVFGFLLMNMRFPWQPRARVFMGNAGSALLGLTIAWASFRLTQNAAHPVTPILAPFLVATPLIDCVVLIARRTLHGQSPFRADRNHMHHRMLEAGFTPAQVTISLVATNLAIGLAASVALKLGLPEPALVLLFIALCIGYFWLTRKRVRAVEFFATLHGFLPAVFRKSNGALAPQSNGAENYPLGE